MRNIYLTLRDAGLLGPGLAVLGGVLLLVALIVGAVRLADGVSAPGAAERVMLEEAMSRTRR